MSNKLLSLIIPTYNMEKYLPRCLDSVTREDVPDSLEVIVVNDGSKDSSLNIAREYESKRPDVVRIIDKENGNYGSCVNAALKIATGKYIKMLDADDWYDTDELIKLISGIVNSECDMFVTHYRWEFVSGKETCIKISDLWSFNEIYDVDKVFSNTEFLRLQMHQIGYRTQLLRDIGYVQTEGISYTDAEWTFIPLFHVKNVVFIDADVYRYYVGRAGQTMDPSVVVKSLSHEVKSLFAMLNYKYKHAKDAELLPNVKRYLDFRANNRALNLYFNALIYMPNTAFEQFNLKAIDDNLKAIALPEYNAIAHYDKRSYLIRRWRRTGHRPNGFVRYFVGKLFSVYSNLKKRWNVHR